MFENKGYIVFYFLKLWINFKFECGEKFIKENRLYLEWVLWVNGNSCLVCCNENCEVVFILVENWIVVDLERNYI